MVQKYTFCITISLFVVKNNVDQNNTPFICTQKLSLQKLHIAFLSFIASPQSVRQHEIN